jgi:hypothetical protein
MRQSRRSASVDLVALMLASFAAAVLVGCDTSGTPRAAPGKVGDFGGGVPVYTFVGPSTGANPPMSLLYIAISQNDPGAVLNVDGPVRITNTGGTTDLVYIPSGSWDCTCSERSPGAASSAQALDPRNETRPIGDAKPITRISDPADVPPRASQAPPCKTKGP